MSACHVSAPPYDTNEEALELVRGFESCTLPFERWTHGAHLTVALWYLLRHPLEEATHRIREGIKSYNAANGIIQARERGYHETLTLFWIKTVSNYLKEAESDKASLVSLANRLIACCGDKNLPLKYYSRELLFSWEARTAWVEPDLRNLE